MPIKPYDFDAKIKGLESGEQPIGDELQQEGLQQEEQSTRLQPYNFDEKIKSYEEAYEGIEEPPEAKPMLPQMSDIVGVEPRDPDTRWRRPTMMETIKNDLVMTKDVAALGVEFITGTVNFLGSGIAALAGGGVGGIVDETPEEAMKRSESWKSNTADALNQVMYLGMKPNPAEEQRRLMEDFAPILDAPRKYLAEPLGDVVTRMSGNPLYGQMTEEAFDLTLNFAIAPKLAKVGKTKLKKYQHQKNLKTRGEVLEYQRRAEEFIAKEDAKAMADIEEAMVPEELMAKQERVAKEELYQNWIERDMAERRNEVMKMEELKTQRDMEYREVFDAAEERLLNARNMEYDARQRMYERLFQDRDTAAFLDSLERRLDEKAKTGEKLLPEEVAETYQEFLVERKSGDVELQRLMENWEAEVQNLNELGGQVMEESYIPGKSASRAPETQSLHYGFEMPRRAAKWDSKAPEGDATGFQNIGINSQLNAFGSMLEELAYFDDAQLVEEGYLVRRPEGEAPRGEIVTPEGTPTPEGAPSQEAFNIEQQVETGAPEVDPLDVDRRTSALRKQSVENLKLDKKSPHKQDLEVMEKKKEIDDFLSLLEEEATKATVTEARKSLKKKRMPKGVKDKLKDKRQVAGLREYMNENHELYETEFETSMREGEPREFTDLWDDVRTLTEGLLDERGSISFKDLDATKQAAANRILRDLQKYKRKAAKTGRTLAEYLVESNIAPRDIAEVVENYHNEVFQKEGGKLNIEESTIRKGDPAKVHKMLENTRKAMEEQHKKEYQESIDTVRKEFEAADIKVRKHLEKSPSIQARRALNRKVAEGGAAPAATSYFNIIDKEIFKPLTSRQSKALDTLIHIRKELSIAARKGKHRTPTGVSYADYAAFMDNAQQELGLSREDFRKVDQAALDYFNVMDDLLEKKFNEGAIDSNLYEILKQNEYAPTQWLQALDLYRYADEEGIPLSVKGRPPVSLDELTQIVTKEKGLPTGDLTTRDSHVHRLKGGMEGYQNIDAQQLLAEAIAGTYSWVYKNRATKSLGKYAEEQGLAGDVVREAKVRKWKTDKEGNKYPLYERPEKGFKELNYYEDGIKRTIHARDWFAEQWSNTNTERKTFAVSLIRTLSLNNAVRAFATGFLKPLFGIVKGIPMDAMYGYFRNGMKMENGEWHSVYSLNSAKYTAQLLGNMKKVAPDVIKRKGRFLEFADEGGLMNIATQRSGSGPTKRGKITRAWETSTEWLNYLNNTAEYLVRMAHREQYMKHGVDSWEATAMARDMLDFAQGGKTAKAIDNVVPYFNTAIQGTRGILSTMKRNRKEALIKATNMAGMSAGLYLMNRTLNKEAYEQENDHNKDNYWILPTGFHFTDSKGNKRWVNFKVRKDPGQIAITTVSELLIARALGDEADFSRALRALVETVSPIKEIPNIPLLNMGFTYSTGKDLLTLNDVYHTIPSGKGGSEEWYAQQTSKFWYDFGQLMPGGASPERSKATAEVVFGRNSALGETMGRGYDSLFRELPQEEQENLITGFLLSNYTPEFISITREPTKYTRLIDRETEEKNGEVALRNREARAWAVQYFNKKSTPSEKSEAMKRFYQFTSQYSREEEKRLVNYFETYGATTGFPHQNMWMTLRGISNPEVRAKAFYEWRADKSPREKRRIDNQLEDLQYNKNVSFIPSNRDTKFWKAYEEELFKNR